MVTGFAGGRSEGAVKRAVVAPVLVTVPSVELPPETPLTSQEIAPPVAAQKEAVRDCD